MKIEGVIFDLDGTLIHTIDDLGDAANTLFKRYGHPLRTTEEFLGWIGNGAVRFIQEAVGKDVSPGKLKRYVEEFKTIYGENLHSRSRIYKGVPGMLDRLVKKDIKISILSNKPHHLTQKVVEHYLSQWPFEPVFGQRDAVPKKPDPAAVFEIAGLMGLEPRNLLFIGDSMNDLKTATAAGMVPVGVSWGYGLKRIKGSYVGARIIDAPGEIPDLIV